MNRFSTFRARLFLIVRCDLDLSLDFSLFTPTCSVQLITLRAGAPVAPVRVDALPALAQVQAQHLTLVEVLAGAAAAGAEGAQVTEGPGELALALII